MPSDDAPVRAGTDAETPTSQPATCRIAAVDIGSNSIRLVVAEASSARLYRLLTDEKAHIALASGAAPDGTLRHEAIEDAAAAISSMVSIAQGLGAEQIRLVATAAVRDAPNQSDFCELVTSRTALPVEILSGDDEARLAHESVAHAFDLTAARAGVLDIGGGSTELALSAGGVIERLISIPIGAVRLTDRFGPADRTDPASNQAMYHFVRRTLRTQIERPSVQPQVLFGTGGTFTTLASIAMRRTETEAGANTPDESRSPNRIRGYEISRAEVKHILHWLRGMDVQQRRAVPGLSADRAGIIIAGITLVEGVMRRLGVNNLRIHDRGVRDGILLEMLRDRFETPLTGSGFPDRRKGVIDFGRRCNFEESHSRHVCTMALSIFDQLVAIETDREGQPPSWSSDEYRQILEAAALLRDVGYFINYTGHHKHSYHLIIHSELPGFSPRELELIGNVARYHRKARPKKRHANYRNLDKADKPVVRRLAAILRIADGLDRTHTQTVDSITLTRSEHRYTLIAHSNADLSADIWGAQRKSDVFVREFGLPIEIIASEQTAP
ncbi:MAG: Ppx/GppA phosphatase family protein [Phycisphaerales bacterium JB065]